MTEYTISKVDDKGISLEGLKTAEVVFTKAALEDELLKSFLCSEKNQRFYYAQAEYFIR
jgi:hypothetical protein